ncbi:type IV pilus biogenesis/stability protein PilW [Permianibacter sp. IMCC34836]|uniref:type IV pilus biogenesis/stability protein PilW n=1 Tax=Permianibacter fluminis TaxID=2738515 RepID=UPI001555D258|nr:type IV pilus biogenesis/stability protein PilW [Permianibacter fluminis]NQD38632.1 type IV pilus biogenesis/stability protein PilW [Permianibacter fluminis]
MKQCLTVCVLMLCLAACSSAPSSQPDNLASDKREKAAEARLAAASGYLDAGQMERAKFHLDKALQHAPDNANVQATLGYYYSLVSENKRAEEHFQKALRLDGDSPGVLDLYGVYLCRQGKYSKAQELFERAIAIPSNPKMASVMENAGLCALRSNAPEKADEYFRRALQHNPKQANALLEMANRELEQQRLERAKGYWDRFKEVGRDTPRSLWVGIQLAHALRDKDTVASLGLKLEQIFPDSEEADLYADKKQQWRN